MPSQFIHTPPEHTVSLPNGDVAAKPVPIEPTSATPPLINPDSGDVACTSSSDGVVLTNHILTVFEKSDPFMPAATVLPTAHAIFPPFTQASKIPGGVSITTITILNQCTGT
jgi:hypothetical protein